MGVMKLFVKMLGKKKREKMMMKMMPLMMEGIDLHEFFPEMMAAMLKEITAEGLIEFIKQAVGEKETLKKILKAIQSANLMQKMMFSTYTSKLPFDETVKKLEQNAINNKWEIPDTRDLQKEYHEHGLKDMTKLKVLYFCNPEGGYSIIKNDENKPMSVMMPMGISVYEKTDGKVEIAAMNLGMMSGTFDGVVKDVLKDGSSRFIKSLEGIK